LIFSDLPTIISGNNLVTFDPHGCYFHDENNRFIRGIKFDFTDPDHQSKYFSKHPNQFSPFNNFTDLELDMNSEFKGTLFRFPIRNKEAAECSELSQEWQPVDKIIYEEILKSFFKDLRLILIFLRNLERVEVYEIKEGKKVLMASTWIDFEQSSQDLREKREFYKNELMKTVNSSKDRTMSPDAFKQMDIEVNFKMVVQTRIPGESSCQMIETSDRYLMSNYVRLASATQVKVIFRKINQC
jgi:hypothetical protein